MFIDKNDMQFLDDSNPEIDLLTETYQSSNTNTKSSKNSTKATGARISARGKKEKKIYDPSDNGPASKKRKEEGSKKLISTPVKTPVKTTPAKSPKQKMILSQKSPAKTSMQIAKRRLELDLEHPPNQKIEQVKTTPCSISITSLKVKEVIKPPIAHPTLTSRQTILQTQSRSTSSERSSSHQTSSTVPIRDNKVPNIQKWTPQDVADYFQSKGFDKKDAFKFKEQEIDGVALLILQRDDLKNLGLKVGIFVKMWNHILSFQSGEIYL